MIRSILFVLALFLCVMAVPGQNSTTLSSKQIGELKAINARSEKRAAPYAARMAATVKRIYSNMLSTHEDQMLRRRLAAQLHSYAGMLLDIRGESYRRSLAVLTPAQRAVVREALKKPDAPTDIGELIDKTFGK